MTGRDWKVSVGRPALPADPVMAVAWRDCLMWAAGEQGIRDAFESDTGMHLAMSPFDRMIDEATGLDAAVAEAFVRWFNENIWGSTSR